MNGKLRRELFKIGKFMNSLCTKNSWDMSPYIYVCNTYYTMCHTVYPLDIALKKYYHRNTIKSI